VKAEKVGIKDEKGFGSWFNKDAEKKKGKLYLLNG
jgi:hypothetical protein